MKKLPKRTKYFFDLFVNNANVRILHPLDWKRFYHFVQAAHEGRTKLSQGELEELLFAERFEADTAERLAYVYYHGRGILKSKISLNYKYDPK